MCQFLRVLCLAVVILCVQAPAAFAKGDTLTIAMAASSRTFDPIVTPDAFNHCIMNQLYECLVGFNAKGELIPLLAEKWDISPDGKTFTFYLRKGVKFHNGEELKADDVIFTFQRATGPEGGGVRAFSSYINPAGLKKIDDYTVAVTTTIPMPATFLQSLTHVWSAPVSKKAVEQYGKDYGMNPVGAGRFRVAKILLGDRVIFERFDDYYGEKAKMKTLIMRTIVEASSRTIELESGAVDLIMDPAATDISRIEANPRLKVIKRSGCRLNMLGFDVTTPPYNDMRVRQALNYAVDRRGIVQVVYRGFAEPAAGPVSSAIKYSRQETSPIVEADIAKAKGLLKEAGFPNGFKGNILTPDRTDMIRVATVLQENFAKIGVQMEVKVIEWGTFLEVQRTKNHDPYVNTWWGSPPALDAFFLMTPSFHSGAIPPAGQTNRFYYKNPEVDALLDKGASMLDGPEREAVYSKLWDILNGELPWLSIATPYAMFGASKELEGVNYNAGTIQNFTTAYFSGSNE